MRLNEQQIQEFRDLYKEHFGKEIPLDDAIVQAEKLIELVHLLRKRASSEYDNGQ